MSRLSGQGWLGPVSAALCLCSGIFMRPALAGGHGDHGTKYDLVQGFIIQPACTTPSAPAKTPSTQTTPSAQTPGVAASVPQTTPPSPPQLSVAPPQVQLSLTPAPAPAPTVALQMLPATPVQTVSLSYAPVQAVQLAAAAPVQAVQLAAPQVQYVQLQTIQTPAVSLAVQQQVSCQTPVVATPVQLLIPQHRWCHFFGK